MDSVYLCLWFLHFSLYTLVTEWGYIVRLSFSPGRHTQVSKLCPCVIVWGSEPFVNKLFFPSFRIQQQKREAETMRREKEDRERKWVKALKVFCLCFICFVFVGCCLVACYVQDVLGGGGRQGYTVEGSCFSWLFVLFSPICLAVWFDVACCVFFSLESVINWNFLRYKWNFFYVHRQHICTDWKKISCTRHVLCW